MVRTLENRSTGRLPSRPQPDVRARNVAFRVGIVLLLIASFLLIRGFKAVFWGDQGRAPENAWDQLMRWGSLTWVILLPWAVGDLAGWMLYRRHSEATEATDEVLPVPVDHEVVYRIVTRGDQPEVVLATVASILQSMSRRALYPYRIEVATDALISGLPDSDQITQLVVPSHYSTPHGATYKARALAYALDVSEASDDAWILHLDEESHVTPEVIVGIRRAVMEEEDSGEHRIGQGLILYYRGLEDNVLYTLADSVRVADDMGRFYLQYHRGRIMFGMHGSFLLVRNNIEKEVGWDFGPQGSITEDTTFALEQMEQGRGFRWVDGYVVEQSPRSAADFMRQRGRWFTGMWWGARHAPARWAHRAPLWAAMALWTVGWLALVYTYIHFLSGVALPQGISTIGDVVFAVYLTNYLLGGWVSLVHKGTTGTKRAWYLFLQLVLLPVYTAIEGLAVMRALLRPAKSFHVIAK